MLEYQKLTQLILKDELLSYRLMMVTEKNYSNKY